MSVRRCTWLVGGGVLDAWIEADTGPSLGVGSDGGGNTLMIGAPTDTQGEPGAVRGEGERKGTAATLPRTVSTKRLQGEVHAFGGWRFLNTNRQVAGVRLLLFAIEMW